MIWRIFFRTVEALISFLCLSYRGTARVCPPSQMSFCQSPSEQSIEYQQSAEVVEAEEENKKRRKKKTVSKYICIEAKVSHLPAKSRPAYVPNVTVESPSRADFVALPVHVLPKSPIPKDHISQVAFKVKRRGSQIVHCTKG